MERCRILAKRYADIKNALKIATENSEIKQHTLIQSYENQIDSLKANEKSLFDSLEARDVEIFKLKNTISSLKLINFSLETENANILEKRNQENTKIIENLTAEIQSLQSELSEFKSDKPQQMIQKLTVDLSLQDAKTDFKENKIKVAYKNSLKSKDTSQQVWINDTDVALNKFTRKYNLQSLFIKKQEHLYTFENQKFYIMLRNGALMYKSGSDFKPLTEIIGKITPKITTREKSVTKAPRTALTSPLHRQHKRFLSNDQSLESIHTVDFDNLENSKLSNETSRNHSSERNTSLMHPHIQKSLTRPFTDRTNSYKSDLHPSLISR